MLGIGRYCRGEKLIGLFNFSEWEKTVSLTELGDYHDLLDGGEVDKRSRRIFFDPAVSLVILVRVVLEERADH